MDENWSVLTSPFRHFSFLTCWHFGMWKKSLENAVMLIFLHRPTHHCSTQHISRCYYIYHRELTTKKKNKKKKNKTKQNKKKKKKNKTKKNQKKKKKNKHQNRNRSKRIRKSAISFSIFLGLLSHPGKTTIQFLQCEDLLRLHYCSFKTVCNKIYTNECKIFQLSLHQWFIDDNDGISFQQLCSTI